MSDRTEHSESSQPSKEETESAFQLLSPGVQRQLWRMGWTNLRPIQVEAIKTILQTEAHCLICAETASGKTEAAFLPILSQVSEAPTGSIRVLYIGPLRALINDQFRRVEDLCNFLELPVYRWHGDVDAAKKAKLVRSPGGVLLITPESLESLFVNRSVQLPGMLGGVRFVVIDELHVFLGSERGLHLQSLLARLRHSPAAGRPAYRVVALSATIGDVAVAQAFIDRHNLDHVHVIHSAEGKELKFRLHAYECGTADSMEAHDEREFTVMRRVAHDLVEHCKGATNLVFADAKGSLEVYADLCGEVAKTRGLPDQFLVHHGSLARDIREDTESAMKSGRPCTALCSSTLELGIDIGNVKMIGQLDAPHSVAGFKQRLGRSGRREGEPRIGRMYVACRDSGCEADLLDRLHLELVQAVAITELLLQGWLEPQRPATLDLSTLTHQVISVISETGGVSAKYLYDQLCCIGPFIGVDQDVFATLLHCLADRDVIEQTSTGELILGLAGEKLRSDRDYYAAFMSRPEFAVLYGDRQIGTLPLLIVPKPNEHIILAGRRWQIVETDLDNAEIHVTPATGRKRPMFLGGAGDLHDTVVARMRAVLQDNCLYAYLNPSAAEVLMHARQTAAQADVCRRPLISSTQSRSLWFTWAGTRIQRTLVAMFASSNIESRVEGPALHVPLSPNEALATIAQFANEPPVDTAIACAVESKQFRKYDRFLSEDLLELALRRDWLDNGGAVTVCRETQRISGT